MTMTMPKPLYAVGDLVYFATTTTERKQHPCPDCLGKQAWHVRSPAGAVYEAPCPRCCNVYQSNRCLDLSYVAHAPHVEIRTIGSVRIDTASDNPVEYMCRETGVGSGNIYREDQLFRTHDEAMQAATMKAAKSDETVKGVRDRYAESVRFCDYELRPAVAAAEKAKIDSLQWEIHDLRQAILEAESLQEAKAAAQEAET